MIEKHNVIGLMSGSSLDGVDLVDVNFWHDTKWHFEIIAKSNFDYDDNWKKTLTNAFYYNNNQLKNLDYQYGTLLGNVVRLFIEKYHLHPEIVSSHGHTIFHRPQEHYTLQIGDGQALADACGVTVVNDFRTEDVMKGGQGAPLVPIGDKLLFSDYPICLNIGGIANISYNIDNQRIAYDICIANQTLNYLSNKLSMPYDEDGLIASSGVIDNQLLTILNSHVFYSQKHPKSLGREFFEQNIKPLLDNRDDIANIMATFVEHIAIQISKSIENQSISEVLVTGGGARNKFLVERIKTHTKHNIVVPSEDIIDYKEAIVFAFIGLLRSRKEVNILKSVTGAESDSSSGKIFQPNK